MSSRLEIFQSIGLSEQKAKETSKNENLAKHLEDIILEVSAQLKVNKELAVL